MKADFTLLLKELQSLSEALPEKNKLLLRGNECELECQFLMGGLVLKRVQVRSKVLATALLQISVNGIIEGTVYTSFRELFRNFALHVKSQALYQELLLSSPSINQVKEVYALPEKLRQPYAVESLR